MTTSNITRAVIPHFNIQNKSQVHNPKNKGNDTQDPMYLDPSSSKYDHPSRRKIFRTVDQSEQTGVRRKFQRVNHLTQNFEEE